MPVNRAILAARAARDASPSTHGTVGTNPALRTLTDVNVMSYAGRHKKRRPGSDKGQGAWRTVSANNRTGRSNPALSDTITTMPRGERYAQHQVKIGAC